VQVNVLIRGNIGLAQMPLQQKSALYYYNTLKTGANPMTSEFTTTMLSLYVCSTNASVIFIVDFLFSKCTTLFVALQFFQRWRSNPCS
jgi:hypothetical protein